MKRRGLFAIVLIIAVLGLFLVYFFSPQPKPEPLPNPNGYDDFVAGGEMISGDPPLSKTATAAECRAYLSTNEAGVDRGRLGLTRKCRVPVENSEAWLQQHLSQLAVTKKLVQAICVAGNLARLEHRPADSASNYLAAIKIGAGLTHGGDMVDALLGIAYEAIGDDGLVTIIEHLNAEQSRQVTQELQQIQAEQEPCDQILDRDRREGVAQIKGITILAMYIALTVQYRDLPKKFSLQYNNRMQFTSQLVAKLAAHAYTLQKGQPPTNWSDLVPDYLKTVPVVAFAPSDTNQLIFQDTHTVPLQ